MVKAIHRERKRKRKSGKKRERTER
jgi:hypothetical protein